MAFRGEQSSGGEDGLEDLTKAIIEDVLRMPGNELCCDCGAAGVCVLLLFVLSHPSPCYRKRQTPSLQHFSDFTVGECFI